MRAPQAEGPSGLDALLLGLGPHQAILLVHPEDLAGTVIDWERPEGEADLVWDQRAPWSTEDSADVGR